MIIRDRAYMDEQGNPSDKMLKSCIKEHQKQLERWNKLNNYFIGQHTILERKMKSEFTPNNRIVCNHARIITVTASSHMVGRPVKYTVDEAAESAFQPIQEAYDHQNISAIDSELEQDCSVFGKAVELDYMSTDDDPVPVAVQLDPRNAFVVHDDTVEHKRMFAVHYFKVKDEEGKDDGYKITVYTASKISKYKTEGDDIDGEWTKDGEEEQHYFGDVPMFEYRNNEEEQGDFEGVISLIDAYNLLQSDRVNDKEAFVDAILVIKGQSFGDDFDETSDTMKYLREHRLLELDKDSEASYLTKQLVEADADILSRTLSEDIHRFSMVPNIADQNFAGNSSGVAMGFKLLLLSELTSLKERYFEAGLYERMKLFSNIFKIKREALDVNKVHVVFTHSLPVNQAEIAGIVAQLAGIVPDELLYGLLWFIPDPAKALEMMKQQKEEQATKAREMFGGGLPEDQEKINAENEENEAEA